VLRLLSLIAVVALQLPAAAALSAPAAAAARSGSAAPVANLWVAPGGSAACVGSSVPLQYDRAGAKNAICDTADHAYHAARSGDVVRVKNGKYAGFAFTADPAKTHGTVVIEPETDYGVTLTSPTSLGGDVGHITLRRFVVIAPGGGFLNSPDGMSRDVTIDGNRINVGQRVDGRPAAIFFFTNIDDYRIVDNVIGPTCCGSKTQSSPVAITIGKANESAPNANHVLIDGNTIQYVLRSAAYWPTRGYGPAPDASCLAATCHMDAIQIWGIQNSTISNNVIDHAEVQGIFIEDAAGAVNENVNIINNSIQVVGGDAAMNLKGVSGHWNIAFNSTPDVLVTGYDFPAAAPGTTVAFEGNEATLLVANSTGNDGGCSGGNPNVTLVYSYNVWRTAGGATSTRSCSTTDRVRARLRYAGLGARLEAFETRRLHGQPGTPSGGAAYYGVDKVRKNRVLGFHLELDVSPRFPVAGRFDLLTRDALPDDAVVKGRRSGCIVWQSRELGKLTKGLQYAVATTRGPESLFLRAEARPRC
jgi:hypothetical protein